MRRRRAVTAQELAEELHVSERTIYRDVRDLSLCGVPIDGEAGVGYRLRPGFDLPPLMFQPEELEALHIGARMVEAWADPQLAAAAQRALERIEAALPSNHPSRTAPVDVYAPDFFINGDDFAPLAPLRRAVRERRYIRFGYHRRDGEQSARTVRPLGLFFWGSRWTLTAWCELRDGFRNFRIDRMDELEVKGEKYPEDSEKSLAAYMATVGEGCTG